MKRVLLILLFLPTLLTAQNRPDWNYDVQQPISADFPEKLPFYNDYLPLQNTYYELNVTLNNVRKLVTDLLKMQPKENAPSGNGFQYEIYTSSSKREPLKVKYNIFTAYGLEVVKSVEVEGGFADVAMLFIYLYDTKFSTNYTPENEAKKHFKQDLAVFKIASNGKASFTIENTKYKADTVAFLNDFNKAKEALKN